MDREQLALLQRAVREQGLDAWLFFDHHQRDPLAYRVLGFSPKQHVTRRWYYLIPAEGEPVGLVHRIEAKMLDELPGGKVAYSGWREHKDGLGELLRGTKRVAMQYSPSCAIPYVSMVDAGTVEFVRGFGVEVVSSADLIQIFDATLNPAQIESHLAAGRKMDVIRLAAFDRVGEHLERGVSLSEWELYCWMREAFARDGLVTDHGPIIAVNEHAADPHYEPAPETSKPMRDGDLLLIDMWAKGTAAGSVYYDITWTGYCGAAPPPEMDNVFSIVRDARDAGFALVKSRREAGAALRGFEVDQATRSLIEGAGYGEFFVHRTGHSIGEEVHGTGANMDDLETHDDRSVRPDTIFSIEPGIYLPAFGIRSEFNVLVTADSAMVTGAIQTHLLRLR